MLNHKKNITQLEKLRKNRLFYKHRKSVLIICLLLITYCLYQSKPVFSSRTIYVPADFLKIQTAVDNAAAGDTIQVAARTYYEHVVINKSLTIVGENPQTTIIDGTANGTIFDLDASNIYISGFTIRNAGNNNNAIISEKVTPTNDNHRITNNIITTSACGIYLDKSNLNTIFNNKFINNAFQAIFINNAGNNNITGNTITRSAYGIRTLSSANNIIVGNTISQTSFGVHLTSLSIGNTIRQNTISGKNSGIYSTSDSTIIHHNTIIDGAYGVYFYNCKSGSIYYNIIQNGSTGIRLYSTAGSHTVNNNKILNTGWALELVSSNGNTFTGNWLLQSTYGAYMTSSSSNTFYHNNFVNNSQQAYSPNSNTWDNGYPSGGNYWSDYTGIDVKNGPDQNLPGSDGIGDSSYTAFSGNIDHYPLMNTWSEHDISVENVSPSTNQANVGSIVDITVTVKNKGKISPPVSETFTVTAKYNSALIETKTVTNLAQDATQILTFNWDTTGVAPGDYMISAEASTVPDELNTDNNQLTDGTVTLTSMADIAVISIQSSPTLAYVGYGDISIDVEVKNEGPASETFDVTVYRNSTAIDTKAVTLDAGATTIVSFTWTTSGVTPGIYNISAIAPPLPGETDTADNSLGDVYVRLKIPGDVNGDKTVDVYDAASVSAHWYPGPPVGPLGYDPIVDINNDGAVSVIDSGIVSAHWYQTEP